MCQRIYIVSSSYHLRKQPVLAATTSSSKFRSLIHFMSKILLGCSRTHYDHPPGWRSNFQGHGQVPPRQPEPRRAQRDAPAVSHSSDAPACAATTATSKGSCRMSACSRARIAVWRPWAGTWLGASSGRWRKSRRWQSNGRPRRDRHRIGFASAPSPISPTPTPVSRTGHRTLRYSKKYAKSKA